MEELVLLFSTQIYLDVLFLYIHWHFSGFSLKIFIKQKIQWRAKF